MIINKNGDQQSLHTDCSCQNIKKNWDVNSGEYNTTHISTSLILLEKTFLYHDINYSYSFIGFLVQYAFCNWMGIIIR